MHVPQTQTAQTTSALAVVAFVFSLTGLLFLPGLICGLIALRQMKKDPTLWGKALAVAAVAIGSILLVLCVLLFLATPGKISIESIH